MVRFEEAKSARNALKTHHEEREKGGKSLVLEESVITAPGVELHCACPPGFLFSVGLEKFENSTVNELRSLTDWEKEGSAADNYTGLLDFVKAQGSKVPGVAEDKLGENDCRTLMGLLSKEIGAFLGKVIDDPRSGVFTGKEEKDDSPMKKTASQKGAEKE